MDDWLINFLIDCCLTQLSTLSYCFVAMRLYWWGSRSTWRELSTFRRKTDNFSSLRLKSCRIWTHNLMAVRLVTWLFDYLCLQATKPPLRNGLMKIWNELQLGELHLLTPLFCFFFHIFQSYNWMIMIGCVTSKGKLMCIFVREHVTVLWILALLVHSAPDFTWWFIR